MPLNPAKVALAVQGGLSVYCATCTNYWDYIDKGSPTCGAKDGCCGPLGGGTFHEYEGPIRDHASICFACGNQSSYVVIGKRDFGVCRRHVDLINQVVETPMYLRTDGTVIAAESLRRKPVKNSVARFIMEVESYYAEKEGRKL